MPQQFSCLFSNLLPNLVKLARQLMEMKTLKHLKTTIIHYISDLGLLPITPMQNIDRLSELYLSPPIKWGGYHSMDSSQ